MPTEHNDHHTSTVCLDGSEVKRQREIHGLTQLYISKVVGVTTDTISRWENNRYPAIRRENAINLAEALEVPLEQILRKEIVEHTGDLPEIVAPARSFRILGLITGLCLGLIVIWYLWGRQPGTVVQVEAVRKLPVFAAPSTTIPVRVEFEQPPGAGGFILRENFPAGWKLVEAVPAPSSLDNIRGVARWIIKSGQAPDRIAYMVRVGDATETSQQATFHGEVIAGSGNNRASTGIGGDAGVKIAPVHWADANGDGHIDDVEMLDTSYIVDDMAGVHIDWDRLERYWDAGGYRWDEQQQQFLPVPSGDAVSP